MAAFWDQLGKDALEEARANGYEPQVHHWSLKTSHLYVVRETKTPDNLLIVGDSRSQVNPLRGQGMSKASVDAVTLDGILRRVQSSHLPADFSQTFYNEACPRVDHLWHSNKMEDYFYSSCTIPVEGECLGKGALLRWYMRNIVKISHKDPSVGDPIWYAGGLLKPGLIIFSPSLVFKVLKRALLISPQ